MDNIFVRGVGMIKLKYLILFFSNIIISPQKEGRPSPVPSSQPSQPSPTRQIGLETRDSATRLETASAAGSAAGMEASQPARASTPPLRTVAFEEFKHERGSEINRILMENKGEAGFDVNQTYWSPGLYFIKVLKNILK